MEGTGYGPYMGGYDDLERKRATYAAAFDTMRQAYCFQRMDELQRKKAEKQRRKNRGILIAIVAATLAGVALFAGVAMRESIGSWNLYRLAMDAYERGDSLCPGKRRGCKRDDKPLPLVEKKHNPWSGAVL